MFPPARVILHTHEDDFLTGSFDGDAENQEDVVETGGDVSLLEDRVTDDDGVEDISLLERNADEILNQLGLGDCCFSLQLQFLSFCIFLLLLFCLHMVSSAFSFHSSHVP